MQSVYAIMEQNADKEVPEQELFLKQEQSDQGPGPGCSKLTTSLTVVS